jgi:NADH-quinone oxidoreductase subunit H
MMQFIFGMAILSIPIVFLLLAFVILYAMNWAAGKVDAPYIQFVYAIGIGLVAFCLVNFGAIMAGLISWLERKIAARMQSRVGPNRVGPTGLLQWVADAVKLILKEDLIPKDADPILFRVAPYLVVMGFAGVFVVIPFGPGLIAADMNLGLFYLVSVTAFVVVGILMSGWASNSKWSLFGAMRSAAQIVSYEIPAGIAIMVPVLIAGTLSTQGLVQHQGGSPPSWFIFHSPFSFAAFLVFFMAQLAEGNRTPFDLAEAESELVSGFNTEYSGFRFSLYFLEEWGNCWVMGAFASLAFLGGWQVPGLAFLGIEESSGLVFQLLGFAVFMLKSTALLFVVLWLRWTLPRVRVDQMMNLCWKYLVPAAFVCMMGTAAMEILYHHVHVARPVVSWVMFIGAGCVPLVLFALQTLKNIRLVGDKFNATENW